MWTLRKSKKRMMLRRIQEDYFEEEDPSQDREAHFVKACPIKMHTDISQEPWWTEMYEEMPDASPAASIFVRACAVEKVHGHFIRAMPHGNVQGRRIPRPPFFCSSLHVGLFRVATLSGQQELLYFSSDPHPDFMCHSFWHII